MAQAEATSIKEDLALEKPTGSGSAHLAETTGANKRTLDEESSTESQGVTKKAGKERNAEEDKDNVNEEDNQVNAMEADEEEPKQSAPDSGDEVEEDDRDYKDGELDEIVYYGGCPPAPNTLPLEKKTTGLFSSLIPSRLGKAATEQSPQPSRTRILDPIGDVILAIRPFNSISGESDPGNHDEIYVQCESDSFLGLSQKQSWQKLFHNVKAAGQMPFKVAGGVDDFALYLVLKSAHYFHGKDEWEGEDWSFDKFQRLAVFCQAYAIWNDNIDEMLSDKKILVRTKNGYSEDVHPGCNLERVGYAKSYIFIRPRWEREAWLLAAWVFKWKTSFEALWKYFVWNSSLDEENRLMHYPNKFTPKVNVARKHRAIRIAKRYHNFLGVQLEVSSCGTGSGTERLRDVIQGDDEYDSDDENDHDDNGDNQGRQHITRVIRGYFPSAVYENIERTREKYMKRHLDVVYAMLKEFSTQSPDKGTERGDLEQWCGALVRGLHKGGLPLEKPSVEELRHLSLCSLREKLDSLFVDNMPKVELPNKEYWENRVRGILWGEGIDEAPSHFAEYVRGWYKY
jgi:hypothetical protein